METITTTTRAPVAKAQAQSRKTPLKFSMPIVAKPKPLHAVENAPTIGKVQSDLKDFERFLLYEKRYSQFNTSRIMIAARHLVTRYAITVPTKEDAYRIEEDLTDRGLTSTTIRHYLRALRYLAEFTGADVTINLPKQVYKQAEALSPIEARALLNACQNLRDLAMVAVLLYCGVRNKELIALRIEDVDLKARLLLVKDRGQGIKNRCERMAHINEDCANILRQWIEQRPIVDSPNLFITVYGEPMKRDRIEVIVRNLGVRAGIGKKIYPHLLRHTCATTMLHNGVAPTDVMIQLGHRSLRSTLVYLHGDLEGVKEKFNNFTY